MNNLFDDIHIGTFILLLLLSLFIFIIIFLIIRNIALWYWRINDIIKNQEQQTATLTQLFEKQNRTDARVNYYKYRALGDNKHAYEYLLYMVLYDLTFPSLKAEERKLKYDALKEKYTEIFKSLGYEFPEYPY